MAFENCGASLTTDLMKECFHAKASRFDHAGKESALSAKQQFQQPQSNESVMFHRRCYNCNKIGYLSKDYLYM